MRPAYHGREIVTGGTPVRARTTQSDPRTRANTSAAPPPAKSPVDTPEQAAERIELTRSLITLGAEVPATAYVRGALVPRLQHWSLADFRRHVDAIRADRAAKLSDVERGKARDLKGEHLDKYIMARLARRAAAAPDPVLVAGSDGLNAIERADAAKIKDPEARARFVTARRARHAARTKGGAS